MNCSNHPEVPASFFCANCGKALCVDCAQQVNGKAYCQDCLKDGIAALPPQPPVAAPANRMALISMCLGIGGWVFFLMELCFDITLGALAALATLGLALLCLVPLCMTPYLGWVGAIVTGHVALHQIKNSNPKESGRSMAVSGLVMGYIPLGITVLGIAIIVILIAVLLASGAPIPTLNSLTSQL